MMTLREMLVAVFVNPTAPLVSPTYDTMAETQADAEGWDRASRFIRDAMDSSPDDAPTIKAECGCGATAETRSTSAFAAEFVRVFNETHQHVEPVPPGLCYQADGLGNACLLSDGHTGAHEAAIWDMLGGIPYMTRTHWTDPQPGNENDPRLRCGYPHNVVGQVVMPPCDLPPGHDGPHVTMCGSRYDVGDGHVIECTKPADHAGVHANARVVGVTWMADR